MKVNILGVKIDDVSISETVKIVRGWLRGKEKHYIVTPNPEILVMAQKDEQLKKVINNADLAIPDGVGLRLSGKIKNVVTGIDLMGKLVEEAAKKGLTVGLLGGRGDVAKRCAECLLRKYPKLEVVFAESGGEINEKGDGGDLGNLGDFGKVDLLFVAFGPPKQEKWIAKNLDKIPVKMAMGVGGAFDYVAGVIPRASRWIRNLGFEWLFRLIVEPWRIKRQLNLIKFIWLILTKK